MSEKNNPGFIAKQYTKMFFHRLYLPKLYKKFCKDTEVEKGKIIFAEMHSDTLPFSMKRIYSELKKRGYTPVVFCRDFAKLGVREKSYFLRRFMEEYATAEYVFICSYFLPVSACKKRPETKVIQLWHSGGLLKKMGADTRDDIPSVYHGNITANYDLVTVSAKVCVPIWEKALSLPKGVVQATGLSRTDSFFDERWNEVRKRKFYELYPEAVGKKIVLYAPSFSGNAADPVCKGIETQLDNVIKNLKEDYFFIIRLHPLLERKYPKYVDEKGRMFKTEDLLPVADMMVTDYSSSLFDYCIYEKPFILYCPDYDDYERDRGFYVDINTFPGKVAKTPYELEKALREWDRGDKAKLREFREKYMGACDGKATDRILEKVGLD